LLSAGITGVFRREQARAVAVLARRLGDLSLAEESVQDAFIAALEHWPVSGIPPAPAAWIITTARNRAIDRLRREASRDERQAEALRLLERDEPEEHDVNDDRLRLIFTCCHPALAIEAQLALTLRLLGGLATCEIAHAFLVSEATMAQRISRAKAKIRAAGIPYRIPEAPELPQRLRGVLAVLYLMFNEGHDASGGEELQRRELVDEALRLGRLLHELLPAQEEVTGLFALMLLTDARRDARTAADGGFVRLADQDRGRWDRPRIAQGQALLRECLARNRPGPYQLQAAIAAVHADARTAADTDWRQIRTLYDQLMAVSPSPVVALNRAVVVAELDGPGRALGLVDELRLTPYPWWHAVRADLLRRLGRFDEAAAAYRTAIDNGGNARDREFLERQLRAVQGGQSPSAESGQ
jgi:RNA polymerase sigma-70 factor (ECF subfamily)